jgi:chromatin structure-remodeling complex subunit RSC1/2
MASGRAPSQTPVPTTETAESAGASSTVSEAEWEGMASLLKNVYDYRDAESVLRIPISRIGWN